MKPVPPPTVHSDELFDTDELIHTEELIDSVASVFRFGEAPGPSLRALTWAGAMREIESILSWVITHEGTYVTFDVRSRISRYVQVRGTDDGRVFIETTGDQFTDEEPYDAGDLIHLVRLGWLPEALRDDTPNWWREADPRWFYAQPMMAEVLVRTLIDTHRATGPSDIEVTHGIFDDDLP